MNSSAAANKIETVIAREAALAEDPILEKSDYVGSRNGVGERHDQDIVRIKLGLTAIIFSIWADAVDDNHVVTHKVSSASSSFLFM